MKNHRSGLLSGTAAQRAGVEPEAVPVPVAAGMAGIGRTFLYRAISSGELPTVKLGRRRLVRVTALRAWLASLENRAA